MIKFFQEKEEEEEEEKKKKERRRNITVVAILKLVVRVKEGLTWLTPLSFSLIERSVVRSLGI